MRRCVRHAARHLKSSCVDSNQEHGYFRASVKIRWGIFGPSITDQRRDCRNLGDRFETGQRLSRREHRENFPAPERAMRGSRKPSERQGSSTPHKRSQANKPAAPQKITIDKRSSRIYWPQVGPLDWLHTWLRTFIENQPKKHAPGSARETWSDPARNRIGLSVSNCMRHRKTGGNFPATDRPNPGNRARAETRETSEWRKRSPSNKPLTSNHHVSVRQGHILRSPCCNGGALGPQLRKHGHRNGWRESTVFRRSLLTSSVSSGPVDDPQPPFPPSNRIAQP